MTNDRTEKTGENTAINGSFEITINGDGVFLKVSSPKDEGIPVSDEIVIKELAIKKVKNIQLSTVKEVVAAKTNEFVKIAEVKDVETSELPEPEIKMLISRDRMEVFLEIIVHKGSRPASYDEVLQKLNKAGVVYGISREAIEQACKIYGVQVTCAQGLRQVDGQNATIKYSFDLENKGRPSENEDGRVNYKDIHMFTSVNEGDMLAEKIPATAGSPGIDVLGQTVPARPGKDVMLPLGKNVKAENNQVIAVMSGQLVVAGNKLHVLPIIEIKGDVDLSTGNIEFNGSVTVRGSVQTGFVVKATGNVEIAGTVSGGTVEGRNVIVRMGIQGMNRGHVKADENVVTKFIENAVVYAGKDVIVNNVVLHSTVFASQNVIVEGKPGLIAGGQVSAGEEIRCKNAGTHLAVSTELAIGVNPLLREEFQNLKKEIKKQEYSLEQTQKALSILKSMDQTTLPPEKKELVLKLSRAQFNLLGHLESMRNRLNEIEQIVKDAQNGRVKASENVYPGVKIVIGTLVKPIRETLKFAAFYVNEGEIKMGSFK